VNISEKASDTIHELRQILEHEPVIVDGGGVMDDKSELVERSDHSYNKSELVERSDYSYGAAGQRLRSMLTGVGQSPPAKTVLFTERPTHIPVTPPLAVPLILTCLITDKILR